MTDATVLGVDTAMHAVESLLAAHRDELDRLNVFPVPDADTGANVLATVSAAAAVAREGGSDGPTVADAAVRAARGNSGIVLAQALQALLDVADGNVLGDGLAERLSRADELARAAVHEPVEGSVLSVLTAAARAAHTRGADPIAGLEAAVDAAHEQVATSPAFNDVLARAGVVDAGARAMALVLEALLAAATGDRPAPPTVDVPHERPGALGCAGEGDGGRYEVMYALESSQAATGARGLADTLRARLGTLGDSVAVVEGRSVLSVHVHTDHIGQAVAAGIELGRPTDVRVDDLRASVERQRSSAGAGAGAVPTRRARVLVGAATAGLGEVVTAHGADVLSLDDDTWCAVDLATVLGAAAADGPVVLLPGRADVAAVAKECAATVDRRLAGSVTVVADVVGPAQVLTALAVLDPRRPDPASAAAALADLRVVSVDRVDTSGADDLVEQVVGLLAEALDDRTELVTVLLGEELPAATADAVGAALDARGAQTLEVTVVAAAVGGLAVVVGVE